MADLDRALARLTSIAGTLNFEEAHREILTDLAAEIRAENDDGYAQLKEGYMVLRQRLAAVVERLAMAGPADSYDELQRTVDESYALARGEGGEGNELG